MRVSMMRPSTLGARPARCASSQSLYKAMRAVRPVPRSQACRVRALLREWPDPEFIAETLEAFPDKGVATVEEARCLFSNGGYTYLDVRSTLETDEIGKVKGSVNIPWVKAVRKYNPETRTKEVVKSPNNNFIAMVEKKFPDKDNAKFIVACSNGKQYSLDALCALEDAGYWNMVGLKGGYTAWFRTFDNKLNRRRSGEYQENYTHDGDSGGIHASGAGFERVDAIERYTPPVY